MLSIIQSFLAVLIFCPYILLIVVALVGKKLGLTGAKAVGYGADVTTPILFFSVALAIEGLWDVRVFSYIGIVLMVIAIAMSYQEWRMKKEMELLLLLRKLWRVYFLLLTVIYIVVLLVGFVLTIIEFSKG